MVTGETISIDVEGSTLVANWDTQVVDENPVFRAGKTDFIVPIPSSTSGISGFNGGGR